MSLSVNQSDSTISLPEDTTAGEPSGTSGPQTLAAMEASAKEVPASPASTIGDDFRQPHPFTTRHFKNHLADIYLAAEPAVGQEARARSTAAKQAINQLLRLPVCEATSSYLAPAIRRLLASDCSRAEWCKRQGIRLLPLTAVDTESTAVAVKSIVTQLVAAGANKKLIAAARGALTRVVERQGTPALVQIAACAQEQGRMAYVYDDPLKRTLNEWIGKANTSLRSLPIDPVNWQTVLDSMPSDLEDTAHESTEDVDGC